MSESKDNIWNHTVQTHVETDLYALVNTGSALFWN
jgi:hypothetical protein